MNDRDKTLTPEESRKLFVCDAFRGEAAQHGRGYQHNTDSRVYQALVDRPHHWHPEAKVLFTEPYPDTPGLQQIMQFLGGALPVIPCVA